MVQNKKVSLFYGLKTAVDRLIPLAGWSTLWAFGFTLLHFTYKWLSKFKFTNTIIVTIIQAISTVLWFVLPSILIERKKLWVSIKDSTTLFRKNWGKTITTRYSVGLIFSIVYAIGLGILLLVIFISTALVEGGLMSNDLSVTIGLSFFFGFYIFYGIGILVQSVFSATVRVALYHYASSGEVVSDFNKELLLNSISTQNKKDDMLGFTTPLGYSKRR